MVHSTSSSSDAGGEAFTAIDLPPAPLRVVGEEGSLHGAEVTAHRLDGERVHGLLEALDGTTQRLTLRTEAPEALEVPFAELRYLAFKRRWVASVGPHPLSGADSGEANTPGPADRFHVRFKDGDTYDGKASASVVDKVGVHLFRRVEDGKLARLFIPTVVIEDYRIGPRLGEVLVDEALASETEVARGVAEQRALRGKRLGDYLKERAVVNTGQLKRALDRQSAYAPDADVKTGAKQLGQILVEQGLITAAQLEEALERQRVDRNKKLGEILEEMGLVGDRAVHYALARKLNVPFVELQSFDIDPEIVNRVPMHIARRYSALPLLTYRGRLVVAMDDPSNVEAIDVLRFLTGHPIEYAVAPRQEIERAIERLYASQVGEAAVEELETSHASTDEDSERERREAERLAGEKPVVRLVNGVVLDAIRRQASDIHIRPKEHEVELLFRIHGSLVLIRRFSKSLLAAVVSRIKIIGGMNIAERRLPQDGRASVVDQGNVVDLRISVVPTVEGESVVVRILNTASGLRAVGELGFNEHDQQALIDLLHRNHGILLVTGPTGSGKSTTLYAALQEVRRQNVNIITVEDPVEYHIDGIEQIQVSTATGFSFARALRHILRHDPDVIMVGEIRDGETAQIAIQSALTGHLVLSTLHTNDAASTITRLLDMGVEPYLVSSTLLGSLAQRLVRQNCPHCIEVEPADPAVRQALGVGEDEVFYRGRGCEECNHTGYIGRLAVYELLVATPGLRAAIEQGASTEALYRIAVEGEMVPLTRNALTQARRRCTSLAEVYRVRLD